MDTKLEWILLGAILASEKVAEKAFNKIKPHYLSCLEVRKLFQGLREGGKDNLPEMVVTWATAQGILKRPMILGLITELVRRGRQRSLKTYSQAVMDAAKIMNPEQWQEYLRKLINEI